MVCEVANPPRQGTLSGMNLKPALSASLSLFGLCTLAFVLAPAHAGDEKPGATQVRHADAKEAAKLVAAKYTVVLDVRTPGEFASGHIAGATNINYLSNDFSNKVAQLDRSKSYLLHCATGGRSTKALPKLLQLGFTNLIHLDGGFKAWQAAGNPVTKP